MRKDGKSQYTIKKEKLLEIKKLLLELKDEIENQSLGKINMTSKNWVLELREIQNSFYYNKIGKIWGIVKDEK